ncbi:TPA: hypothetical protein ROY05_004666 [Bacillus toyonensis]|nr:hypothetical protein [Bacillus toyonensis]
MSNDILSFLTALGNMSIDKFKGIYDVILRREFRGSEDECSIYPYFQLLSDLEMLGHCEVDYMNRKIYVCPPSFALLPSRGLPRIVLAGGRCEDTINHLYRLAKKNPEKLSVNTVESVFTENIIFPPAIYIEAKNQKILKKVVEIIGVEGNPNTPACWSLLAVVPDLHEVIDSLEYNIEIELNWRKNTFCNLQLQFKKIQCSDKVKLINYTNPMSLQQQTWLWNEKQAAKVDRYWGRYIVLAYYKMSVLMFDEINQRLAVPVTVPLPKEVAKVAALCSGHLPREKMLIKQVGNLARGTKVTVYGGVPKQIAIEICRKLGQDLIEYNL